ncbi:MAG: HD domain-containing protein [Candidatus Omnitrophica bacterium]|nr:HD domain-containing protein [Candidatus Omnitrophota bacterium]
MRAGVIDIGSNSIKLMIGERVEEKINILESLKNIVPLGKFTFFEERIPQNQINQIISVLEKYKMLLKQYDITETMVIATTAVREARNRDIFIDAVHRKTGFPIEVLNVGDVVYYIDAYLSYKLKDTFPIHEKNVLIAELGAGSLDISVMRKGFTVMSIGMPIGTLMLKQFMNKLDGSMQENIEAVKEHIAIEFAYLKRMLPKIKIDDIILIYEDHTYIQNIVSHEKRSAGFSQLTRDDSNKLLESLEGRGLDEISRTHKIPVDVSDTLGSYALILGMMFDLTENSYIFLLQTSLPEALLANMLLKLELSEKYNKTNQLISVATALCQRFDMDMNHVRQVAQLSKMLFDHLREHLSLNEPDALYLILAAYLHDIGQFVHNRSHHKHSEYIISALNLFRLTDEEIKIIACVARYHRRAAPNKAHLLYSSLPLEKKILVQKFSAILRIANALDRSHRQKVKTVSVKLGKAQELTIVVATSENFVLEKAEFNEKKDLMEEITGSKVGLSVTG